MIEFLPPREDAFGAQDGAGLVRSDDDGWADDGDADDGDEAPRSRWATFAATATVLALLTAGVVAAAPWRDDGTRDAAPTTTVAAVPTTAASTGAGVRPLDPTVTGWLLDPPVAGQRLVSVRDPGDRSADLGAASGWAEVWAAPGATRTSGRWVSIAWRAAIDGVEVTDGLAAGWFPVDVAGRPGRARVGGDGVVELALRREAADGGHLLTVTAGGAALPDLVAFAAAVAIDDRPPGIDDDGALLGGSTLLDGLEQIVATPSPRDQVDALLIGPLPGGEAFYVGPDPADLTLVREHPRGSIDPRLAALAFSPGVSDAGISDAGISDTGSVGAPWAFFDGFVPDEYTVGERDMGGIDVRVVRFVTGDSDVWLVTTMSAGVLPAMLDDVRRVTAADWAAARDDGAADPPPVTLDLDDTELTIGGGTVPDGRAWSATLSLRRGELDVVAGDDRLGPRPLTSVIGVDRGGALGTVALDDAMVVVAASSVEGAELRVRWADGTTLSAPLTELIAVDGPPGEPGRLEESFWTSWQGTRTVAVLAEPASPGAPFVAEVVAPDGASLARFDPWSLGGAA